MYTERTLSGLRRLSANDSLDEASLDLHRLLPLLLLGLGGKSPAGKRAARSSCTILANGIGATAYVAAVMVLPGLGDVQAHHPFTVDLMAECSVQYQVVSVI